MTNCKHISTCPFWAKFNDCIDECPCYANADIVEVVRCKDFIHAQEYDRKDESYLTCPYYDDLLVENEHFCSYGERRTDDKGN